MSIDTLEIRGRVAQQMSHFKRTRGALLSIESWLLSRDPYNGLWNNPHLTVL